MGRSTKIEGFLVGDFRFGAQHAPCSGDADWVQTWCRRTDELSRSRASGARTGVLMDANAQHESIVPSAVSSCEPEDCTRCCWLANAHCQQFLALVVEAGNATTGSCGALASSDFLSCREREPEETLAICGSIDRRAVFVNVNSMATGAAKRR